MSERPAEYTAYHPRWLRYRTSTYWWLERWSYFAFILRELSSLFIAWFVVYLLLLVRAVGQGQSSYQQLLDWSANPAVVTLNVVSLCFVVFHAITWFNLAPQAMAVRVRGKRLPGRWITASNYVAWAVVSGVMVWLLLGARGS
jgi:fumarate reductase subunit C